MKPVSRRRFTIADAMILIATSAVGWFGVQSTLGGTFGPRRIFAAWRARTPGPDTLVVVGLAIVVPFLATTTAAILIMRLRRPRPTSRRLFRQPGTVACVAALLAMLIEAGWVASLLAMKSWLMGPDLVFVLHVPQVGFAVVGGWLSLAMAGRWRPEPGWIDRAGRVVGVCWIVATLLWWSRDYLN